MPSDLPIITLRLSHEDNAKIKYIASDNCRKINDEIKKLVLNHIKEYEAKHGDLIVEENGSITIAKPNSMGKSSTSRTG